MGFFVLTKFIFIFNLMSFSVLTVSYLISILEALILWMIEQWQIFGFGGTSTFSIARSFSNIAASVAIFAILLYSTFAGNGIEGKDIAKCLSQISRK